MSALSAAVKNDQDKENEPNLVDKFELLDCNIKKELSDVKVECCRFTSYDESYINDGSIDINISPIEIDDNPISFCQVEISSTTELMKPNNNSHVSVVDYIEGACDWISSHTSCTLCSFVFPMPSRLKRHFEQIHIKKAVKVAGLFSLLCKCKQKEQDHYHCSICQYVTVTGNRLIKHFNRKHFIKADPESLTNERCSNSSEKDSSYVGIYNGKNATFTEYTPDNISKTYGNNGIDPVSSDRGIKCGVFKSKKPSAAIDHMSYGEFGNDSSDEDNADSEAHISVVKNSDRALDWIVKNMKYDCPLCPKLYTLRCRLKKHYEILHVNHGLKIANRFCLLCKCDIFPTKSHYHCPRCDLVESSKWKLFEHFNVSHVSTVEDIIPYQPNTRRKNNEIKPPPTRHKSVLHSKDDAFDSLNRSTRCHLCLEIFDKYPKLRLHMHNEHVKLGIKVCISFN